MKKHFAFLLGIGMAVAAADSALAQCRNGINPVTGERCANAVTSAVPFLRITPDSRGGAMGDAGIATSADANSMHYNPSKIAFADKKVSISATFTPWMRAIGLNDVYLAYLSGYSKLDERQAIGFSLRYFSMGQIDFTDEFGAPQGTGRPNEFELAAGYSRKLSDKLSAGVAAKFIYSNLATGQQVEGSEITPGIAGAADMSLTYRTPMNAGERKGDFTFGLAISNLGNKVTYTKSNVRDYLPMNLGLGLAYTLHLDDFNRLTITGDFNKLLVPTPCDDPDPANCDGLDGTTPDDVADYRQYAPVRAVFSSFSDAPGGFQEELKEITTGIGLEYWYDDQFAVRGGYFGEHYSKGNRKYFTVGMGVKYQVFGLNLSYIIPTTNRRNPLDNTLRFSLIFDFEAFDADESAN
jgi:Type IX secretion system protein PorV